MVRVRRVVPTGEWLGEISSGASWLWRGPSSSPVWCSCRWATSPWEHSQLCFSPEVQQKMSGQQADRGGNFDVINENELLLTLFVSWVSIIKLWTCFSALVNSSFFATTATTKAVQPAPCERARTDWHSAQCGFTLISLACQQFFSIMKY